MGRGWPVAHVHIHIYFLFSGCIVGSSMCARHLRESRTSPSHTEPGATEDKSCPKYRRILAAVKRADAANGDSESFRLGSTPSLLSVLSHLPVCSVPRPSLTAWLETMIWFTPARIRMAPRHIQGAHTGTGLLLNLHLPSMRSTTHCPIHPRQASGTFLLSKPSWTANTQDPQE